MSCKIEHYAFKNFDHDSKPLYKGSKILRFNDLVDLQNCLFIHDFLNRKLPRSFNDYFHTVADVHRHKTKTSDRGHIFLTNIASVRYGLNSITRKCIVKWNEITKELNCNLKELSRTELKCKLTNLFLSQ